MKKLIVTPILAVLAVLAFGVMLGPCFELQYSGACGANQQIGTIDCGYWTGGDPNQYIFCNHPWKITTAGNILTCISAFTDGYVGCHLSAVVAPSTQEYECGPQPCTVVPKGSPVLGPTCPSAAVYGDQCGIID